MKDTSCSPIRVDTIMREPDQLDKILATEWAAGCRCPSTLRVSAVAPYLY